MRGSPPHTPTYSHTLLNPNQSFTLNSFTNSFLNTIIYSIDTSIIASIAFTILVIALSKYSDTTNVIYGIARIIVIVRSMILLYFVFMIFMKF